MANYGGHEYYFVEEEIEKYTCNICTNVLKEPHLTDCCGQHFCESCLTSWFLRVENKSCPHCRTKGFTHIVNKSLKREINALKILCPHTNEGCEWIGDMETLTSHFESSSGCQYVKSECPNGCMGNISVRSEITTLQRKDLPKHVQYECYLRLHQCTHCGTTGTYEAYISHEAICPMFPLPCRNKCNTKDIKRKDKEAHREQCPREPVECPFLEAGCKKRPERQDLDKHTAENQQQHVLMLMAAYRATKQDLKTAVQKQTENEKAVKEMKQSLSIDVGLLRNNRSSETALASIHSLLETTTTCSLINGQEMVIRMPNFSSYKHSGKVWYGPPFYTKKFYKMSFAVHATGIGSGTGSHISISLNLLQGEYDNKLQWPLNECGIGLSVQLVQQTNPRTSDLKRTLFFPCKCENISRVLPEDGCEYKAIDAHRKFAFGKFIEESGALYEDSLLWKLLLVMSFCECTCHTNKN